QAVVHDLLFECVVIMYPLASSDDFPVTFRSNQICAQHRPWIIRVLFHIEGFDLFRIVYDEYREIEMICDFSFMRCPEVLTHSMSSKPLSLSSSIASVYVIRGNGALIFLRIEVSRSSASRSNWQCSRTSVTIYSTYCS